MFIDETLKAEGVIAGIDEAGRGCLAGPVVVASVSWDPRLVAKNAWFSQLTDSKKLKAVQRNLLYGKILAVAERARIAVISNHVIDFMNILASSLHGFELVAPMPDPAIPLVVDGNHIPPSLRHAIPMVKGDLKVSAVAAASVLAKVFRDQLMQRAARSYPHMGFERHMGYGTAEHKRVIETHGPGPLHRMTYAPVRTAAQPMKPDQIAVWLREKGPGAQSLSDAWRFFCQDYHRIPLPEARALIHAFQAQGWPILPSPANQFPPSR